MRSPCHSWSHQTFLLHGEKNPVLVTLARIWTFKFLPFFYGAPVCVPSHGIYIFFLSIFCCSLCVFYCCFTFRSIASVHGAWCQPFVDWHCFAPTGNRHARRGPGIDVANEGVFTPLRNLYASRSGKCKDRIFASLIRFCCNLCAFRWLGSWLILSCYALGHSVEVPRPACLGTGFTYHLPYRHPSAATRRPHYGPAATQ